MLPAQAEFSPAYFDCNATTPVDPGVLEVCLRYLRDDYGNAASRTHAFGALAKRATERGRDEVASVVGCDPDEVVFTSGATESNNIALLGLRDEGIRTGRRHIVVSAIEHKSVLEPLEVLTQSGFEVTLIRPNALGWIEPDEIRAALRPETLIVSLMQVNNETGVVQPLPEVAAVLRDHPCYFHVDAAQGFGKLIESLREPRIDLIGVSGHKIYAPKGIGALITRRRNRRRVPLTPLMYGGGQERGLRPGTLPVHLIASLGEAARLACRNHAHREARVLEIRAGLLEALRGVPHELNGDTMRTAPNTLNVRFTGIDSEALMVGLKDLIAVSNGSACTSASYAPSHVLAAMGLPAEHIQESIRISWCHLTPKVRWDSIISRLRSMM
jgi:cysteine desulfurase